MPGKERVTFLGEGESMKEGAWVGSSYPATISGYGWIGNLLPSFGT